MGKASDEQIIKHAIKNNQILVTKDLEFGNIKKYPIKEHKGIILIRAPFYYTAIQINEVLFNFFNSLRGKEIRNSLVIVEVNKYRIRK